MLGAYYTKDVDSKMIFENLKLSNSESYLDHLNKN